MATFLDRHLLSAMPRAVRYQMHLEAVDGLVDPSGTLPLAHWIEDGALYCLLQAPDAQAVCAYHAARGLGCDDLHPIAGLHGSPVFMHG